MACKHEKIKIIQEGRRSVYWVIHYECKECGHRWKSIQDVQKDEKQEKLMKAIISYFEFKSKST
jgi:uncharacterized Zn finger protein